MKLSAYLLRMRHHIDQLIRQIHRMRSHKTDPLQSLDLIHLLQKLRKGDRMLQILSIRIDILSQQHNFNNTICHQLFDLLNDLLRFPAALPSPDIWHDTIAAEVVAAKHNVNTALKGIFPLDRKLLHNRIRVLPDIHDHPLFRRGIKYTHCQQLCKLKYIVGSKNNIHIAVACFDLIYHGLFLHHTSAKHGKHFRILLFVPLQLAQMTIHL